MLIVVSRKLATWCGVIGLVLVIPYWAWNIPQQMRHGFVEVLFGKYEDKVLFGIHGVGAVLCFAAARYSSKAWYIPFAFSLLIALAIVFIPTLY